MGNNNFIRDFQLLTKPASLRPEYRYKGIEISGRYKGVYINMDVTARRIELVEIMVPASLRAKGKGTAALDMVVALATQNNMRIVAIPEQMNGPLNTSQLTDWYRRHGVTVI